MARLHVYQQKAWYHLKAQAMCFSMIPWGTFQGYASLSTTVLKLWCKNAVGSLLNPCDSGLQTVCKPQVVTMVQLTAEQRIFVVMKFHETRSLQATQDAFGEAFPDREPPAKKTIWANVRKYEAHGTSLNRNKGRSGRPRTARSQENITAVRQQLIDHPQETSARRNQSDHLSGPSFPSVPHPHPS